MTAPRMRTKGFSRTERISRSFCAAVFGAVSFAAMLLPIETGRAEQSAGRASGGVSSGISSGISSGVSSGFSGAPASFEGGRVRLARLPAVLSPEDQSRYRRIFAALKDDDFSGASKILESVGNRILAGHVLAQKYLDPRYRPSFSELSEWLDSYRDLPFADRIYVMARAKAPKRHGPITEPGAAGLPDTARPVVPAWKPAFEGRTPAQIARIKAQDELMQSAIAAAKPDEAERRFAALDELGLLTGPERDERLGRIVFSYFNRGLSEEAVRLSEASRPSLRAPLPRTAFSGGLAAWRLGQYERAAALFETVSAGADIDPSVAAAGDFWAARANLAAGRMKSVSLYLRRAAVQRTTLYGILAQRQLGLDIRLNLDMPDVAQDEVDAVAAFPGVRRALALSEIGEIASADEEIRLTFMRAGRAFLQPLVVIAAARNLPYGMTFMTRMSGNEANYSEAVRFPVPSWAPQDGFTVDPALVYAISRQESEFRARAGSPAGAQGLMQLMPATAALMDSAPDPSHPGIYRLQDPSYNLMLGQRYIGHLRSSAAFSDDSLMPILAAYNWGPGNVSRWLARTGPINDPLLFLESIPVDETRRYVNRVMANYWIYRIRLGFSLTSLDAMVAGDWPRYQWGGRIADARN